MSAAKVMAYTVIVRHPETNTATAVLAGEPVPDWAKDLVHDDDLVKGSDSDSSTGGDSKPKEKKSKDKAKAKSDDTSSSGGDNSDSGDDAGSGEPPRTGKGSGVDAWKVYALTLGLEVPDNASRADVLELVDAHSGS